MSSWLRAADARVKLVCLAAFVTAALCARSAVGLGVCVAVSIAAAAAVRLPARSFATVLKPFAVILVVTVIMQVLCIQQGEVLAVVGPVVITADALIAAGRMLASLFSVMLASVSFMRCTTTEELLRTVRWLLAPLRAVGVRVDAFCVSLSLAFGFVPVLVGEWRQLVSAQAVRGGTFDGPVGRRVRAYARLFAPLARSSFRHADALAEAMVARAFGSGIRATTLHAGRFGAREILLIVLAAVVVAASFAL